MASILISAVTKMQILRGRRFEEEEEEEKSRESN